MKKIENAVVIENKKVASNIYDMFLKSDNIAKESVCGQFIEMYVDNGVNILPRPISICEINASEGIIRIMFQVVGNGTAYFSGLKRGDIIRVLGPCGNGFNIKETDLSILVGGGIGIPPLFETAKRIKGRKIVVLGFKNKDSVILKDEFEKLKAEVLVSSDDGSIGFKGNVVELIKEKGIVEKNSIIYSCGPIPMLKALSEFANETNTKCMISLEERMACGVGACVGCAVKVFDKNEKSEIYKKVCTDGPVFSSKEVIFDA